MIKVLKVGCFLLGAIFFASQADAQLFRRWSPSPLAPPTIQQQYYSQQTQRNCPDTQRRLAEAQLRANQVQTQNVRVQYVLIPQQQQTTNAERQFFQEQPLQSAVESAREALVQQQREVERLEQLQLQQQAAQAQQQSRLDSLRQQLRLTQVQPQSRPSQTRQTYYLIPNQQQTQLGNPIVSSTPPSAPRSPGVQQPVVPGYVVSEATTTQPSLALGSQFDIARSPTISQPAEPAQLVTPIEPAVSTPQGTLRPDSKVVPASANLMEDTGVSILQQASEAVDDPGSLKGLELIGPEGRR